MSHGMKARDANVPSGDVFDLVSQYRVDFVQDQLSDLKHDLTIGIGDSLGVPAIEGMALADHDLFDVISLRDGWNLREKESAITGIARYLGYQVSDAINSRLHPRNFNIPPSAYADVPLSQPSEVSGLGKIWNVAPAMIGYEAQESAIELAGKIAMQVKLFDHGLSGTIDQARAFQKQLDKARTNGTAPLRVDIVPGWHDHLMDPARGAHDVMNALKLLSK